MFGIAGALIFPILMLEVFLDSVFASAWLIVGGGDTLMPPTFTIGFGECLTLIGLGEFDDFISI